MGSRLELHSKLLEFLPNVYFQKPSDVRLVFPCIVYSKKRPQIDHANDKPYRSMLEYQVTVIEYDPDSELANQIVSRFQHSTIGSYFTMDNLNHTVINLYY